jgi:predicted TIM-barrel fold metal-dependent hydrolase
MADSGVEKSVLCLIATRPGQFASILAWAKEIRSDKVIPFPSFHPDDPDAVANINRIADAGFRGIKMHPYYQGFLLDEERMLALYEKIRDRGLVLVMHTGFDIGFPRQRIADPARVLKVLARVPDLKLVTTHLGAWDMWDEVEALLLGRPIYMDISYSLDFLAPQRARHILLSHPQEYILFGTDSPWAAQASVITQVKELSLGAEREAALFSRNAMALLGLPWT